MGVIKDRIAQDLTEAEKIKERWQTVQKDLNDLNNQDGVATYLEPDVLECEVKGAFEIVTVSKASGGDGILAELMKILKDYAVKVLPSICHQTWKT